MLQLDWVWPLAYVTPGIDLATIMLPRERPMTLPLDRYRPDLSPGIDLPLERPMTLPLDRPMTLPLDRPMTSPLGLTFIGNELWPCPGIDLWPFPWDWPSSGTIYDPAVGSISDFSPEIDLPLEQPMTLPWDRPMTSPLGLTFLVSDLWPCPGIDLWPLLWDWPSLGTTFDAALGSTSDLSSGIDLPRERPFPAWV